MSTIIKVGDTRCTRQVALDLLGPWDNLHCIVIMEVSRRWGKEGVFLSSKPKVCGISSVSCSPGNSVPCYGFQVPGRGSLELVPWEIVSFSIGPSNNGGKKRWWDFQGVLKQFSVLSRFALPGHFYLFLGTYLRQSGEGPYPCLSTGCSQPVDGRYWVCRPVHGRSVYRLWKRRAWGLHLGCEPWYGIWYLSSVLCFCPMLRSLHGVLLT